jgi:small subunit ribosomal protein S21e
VGEVNIKGKDANYKLQLDIMSNLVNREFELGTMRPLKNTDDKIVEKYLPRKCAITSKILGPKDYASVQLFVPDVDENGRVKHDTGYKFAVSGFIRAKGRADFEIEKLLKSQNHYPVRD